MKFFYISLTALLFSFGAYSQTDTVYFNRSFEGGINGNQTSFSSNWKGGGIPSVAVAAFINFKSEKRYHRHQFTTDYQLAFGQFYNQPSNIKWRKNIDRLYLDNKYGYFINDPWAVFGALTFQSQFYRGYKFDPHKNAAFIGQDSSTLISNFLAPGYLDEALGLEFKKYKWFTARLGFIAFRQIFSVDKGVEANVRNNDGKHYGVDPGLNIKNQFGLNVVLKLDYDFSKRVNLEGIYQYFSEYSNIAVSVNRLDAIFTARISSVLNTNIQTVILYNQDQDLKTQWSQGLALGLVYNFSNFPKK